MYRFITMIFLGRMLNSLAKLNSVHYEVTAGVIKDITAALLGFTNVGTLLQDIKRLEGEYTMLTEGYNAVTLENESLRSRVTEYSNRIMELQGQIELLKAPFPDTTEDYRIPWDDYPDYNWFAIDDDGNGYMFKEEPSIRAGVWESDGDAEYVSNFPTDNWKNSLQKRPENA